jgi:hypothetical protein
MKEEPLSIFGMAATTQLAAAGLRHDPRLAEKWHIIERS